MKLQPLLLQRDAKELILNTSTVVQDNEQLKAQASAAQSAVQVAERRAEQATARAQQAQEGSDR